MRKYRGTKLRTMGSGEWQWS